MGDAMKMTALMVTMQGWDPACYDAREIVRRNAPTDADYVDKLAEVRAAIEQMAAAEKIPPAEAAKRAAQFLMRAGRDDFDVAICMAVRADILDEALA